MRGAPVPELADAGVGWVVVESGSAALDLPVAYRDDDLAVYRVGGDRPGSADRWLLIGAHVAWLAVLVGSLVAGVVGLRRWPVA